MGLWGGDSGTLGAPFIAYGIGVGGTPGCTCWLTPTPWDRGGGDCGTLQSPLHCYGMGMERTMGVLIVPNPMG